MSPARPTRAGLIGSDAMAAGRAPPEGEERPGSPEDEAQEEEDRLRTQEHEVEERERERQLDQATRKCQKDGEVDLQANQRVHHKAALRGVFGLKHDLFYEPPGHEGGRAEAGKEKTTKEEEEEAEDDGGDPSERLEEHYLANFVELANLLAKGLPPSEDEDSGSDEASVEGAGKFDPAQRLAALKRDIQRDVLSKFGLLRLDYEFASDIRRNEKRLFGDERPEEQSQITQDRERGGSTAREDLGASRSQGGDTYRQESVEGRGRVDPLGSARGSAGSPDEVQPRAVEVRPLPLLTRPTLKTRGRKGRLGPKKKLNEWELELAKEE